MFAQLLNTISRHQAAETLQKLVDTGSRSPVIRHKVAQLNTTPGLSHRQRLELVWRWLPSHYVADRNGDNWQTVEVTDLRGVGDCEDWAVYLAAVLQATDLDARIGVMPEHAAVFVPVSDGPRVLLDPFIGWVPNRNLIPSDWKCIIHQGRKWLPLEATTTPNRRSAPGVDDRLIRPWINTSQLVIGGN